MMCLQYILELVLYNMGSNYDLLVLTDWPFFSGKDRKKCVHRALAALVYGMFGSISGNPILLIQGIAIAAIKP